MMNPPTSNISLGPEEIESRFGFHKATIEGSEATVPKHANLRIKFREFANFLDEVLPNGRYKKLMEAALEMASMWAHKAIAQTAPILGETTPSTEEAKTEAEMRKAVGLIHRLKDEGLSDKEIGERLNLVESTVRKMLEIGRGPVFTD